MPGSLSAVIDDEWRAEKFTDLDIILASNTIQRKLSIDNGDEEQAQRMPITEVKEWGDLGVHELIGSWTEPKIGGDDSIGKFR